MLDAATRRLEAGGSTFKSRRRHPMVVSCATCAVRVPGALGRGGLPACKVRAGQLYSCVHMVQRMTFRAQNVQKAFGCEGTYGSEDCRAESV